MGSERQYNDLSRGRHRLVAAGMPLLPEGEGSGRGKQRPYEWKEGRIFGKAMAHTEQRPYEWKEGRTFGKATADKGGNDMMAIRTTS